MQLKDKTFPPPQCFIAINEITDITDVLEICIFFWGVDEDIYIIKEFVELELLKGQTYFSSLSLDKHTLEIYGILQMTDSDFFFFFFFFFFFQYSDQIKTKIANLYSIHCKMLCSKGFKMNSIIDILVKNS